MAAKPKPKALSQKALRTQDQPISYLMTMALQKKGLISLAAGFVDYDTLPVEDVRLTLDELLGDPAAGRAALQYGTTSGFAELRELLLDRLCRREGLAAKDLKLTADHVIVTSGSQQLLYLISSVLLDPGDIVLLARPTYFVYTGTLQAFGAQVAGIDIDGEGLRADALDARLKELEAAGQLGRVKLLYTCSYFDNPTGLTLSAKRRQEIVKVVRRWRKKQHFYLLEDAAYRDLAYDAGAEPPSMKTLDPDNDLVILAQTFSKPLCPGLKTGYGYLPHDLVGPVLDQKGNHDFGSANLCQHLAHRMIVTGRADAHLRRLCDGYRPKRDALIEALREYVAPLGRQGRITWTQPGGGLYVWLTLPPQVNTDLGGALFKRALDRGVIYVPGSFCYCPEDGFTVPRHHLRLSFGVPSVADNREGVRRLAEAIREELA